MPLPPQRDYNIRYNDDKSWIEQCQDERFLLGEAMSHATTTKRSRLARLYERDLYAWSREQARLLKEGRLDEVDAENVAEEILDVGSNEYDKLESALRVLLMHMLKWDHQPEKRTRSWEATIAVQRNQALKQLRKNPSLKARTGEAVREAYADARLEASGETDLDVETFPEDCPYNWDTIFDREFKR
jgi:hypothetical protein